MASSNPALLTPAHVVAPPPAAQPARKDKAKPGGHKTDAGKKKMPHGHHGPRPHGGGHPQSEKEAENEDFRAAEQQNQKHKKKTAGPHHVGGPSSVPGANEGGGTTTFLDDGALLHRKRVKDTRRAIGQFLSDEGLRKDPFLLNELRKSRTEPPSVALATLLEHKKLRKVSPKLAIQALWNDAIPTTELGSYKAAYAFTAPPEDDSKVVVGDHGGAGPVVEEDSAVPKPQLAPPEALETTTTTTTTDPAEKKKTTKMGHHPFDAKWWRVGRDFAPEMRQIIKASPVLDAWHFKTVHVRNASKNADLTSLFAPCGRVERCETDTEDDRAAFVVFADDLGAIRAVEKFNDDAKANWRGARVSLKSGLSASAARRAAGYPPLTSSADTTPTTSDGIGTDTHAVFPSHETPNAAHQEEQQPSSSSTLAVAPRRPGSTTGDDGRGPVGGMDAPPDNNTKPSSSQQQQQQQHRDDPNVSYDWLPDGRRRGKLVYLKPGKYGFVRPRDARAKEDNAFFLVSELYPRTLKVDLGDWLEYAPELHVDRDGVEKKQAKRLTKCDPPPPPKVVVHRNASTAANAGGASRSSTTGFCPNNNANAAAAEKNGAEKTASAGNNKQHTSLSRLCDALGTDANNQSAATPATAEARPSRLRLRPPTKNGAHPEQRSQLPKERVAKGPDGTAGFARPRTKLRVAAVAFVPGGADPMMADGSDDKNHTEDRDLPALGGENHEQLDGGASGPKPDVLL